MTDRILEPESETEGSLTPEDARIKAALTAFEAQPTEEHHQELVSALTLPDGATDELRDSAAGFTSSAEGPAREHARRKLLDVVRRHKPLSVGTHFRPASRIKDKLPRPILRAADQGGAMLAEGAVCLLSGAGGIAKSTLAATLALHVAYGSEIIDGSLSSGYSRLFDVQPGAVMLASYEDPLGIIGWRLQGLAAKRYAMDGVLDRVHVADFAGLPLYGPGANGLYTARPEKLRGWHHLWKEADRLNPKLVIIDPALDAYVGEANNLGAVREFVSTLAVEARQPGFYARTNARSAC